MKKILSAFIITAFIAQAVMSATPASAALNETGTGENEASVALGAGSTADGAGSIAIGRAQAEDICTIAIGDTVRATQESRETPSPALYIQLQSEEAALTRLTLQPSLSVTNPVPMLSTA